MIYDLSRYELNKEQIEILKTFKVPLFHHFKEDKCYIAHGYWHSIKPELQKALIRLVHAHE